MMVVIDTNELLRMAAARDMSPLFAAWRANRFDLALSSELLAEIRDAANKPRVRRFLSLVRLQRFISVAIDEAVFVELVLSFPHCRDPKDDVVIATAVAAHAEYIVTNDGDLHEAALVARLRDEWGIQVVWPNEFLETQALSR